MKTAPAAARRGPIDQPAHEVSPAGGLAHSSPPGRRAHPAAGLTHASSIPREACPPGEPSRQSAPPRRPHASEGASHPFPLPWLPGRQEGPSHPSAPLRRPHPARLERRAGRLLRALRDTNLLDRLGYVRLGDFVVERLGVSYRTAQEWMRVDEALARSPLVAAAWEAGEITSAHVRLLTRVVGLKEGASCALAPGAAGQDGGSCAILGRAQGLDESSCATAPREGADGSRECPDACRDEASWLALARRLDVRGLARAVEVWEREAVEARERGPVAAQRRDGAYGDVTPGDSANGSPEEHGPDGRYHQEGEACGPQADDAGDHQPVEARGRDGAGGDVARADSASGAPGEQSADSLLDDDKTVPFEISVPAWLAASWRETVTFVRQLAGAVVSRGECFEMVVAELLGSLSPALDGTQGGGDALRAHPARLEERLAGKSVAVSGLPPPARDGQEAEGSRVDSTACDRQQDDRPDLPSSASEGQETKVSRLDSPACDRQQDDRPDLPSSASESPSKDGGCPGVAAPASPEPPDVTELDARAIEAQLLDIVAVRQRHDWGLAERLTGVAMMRIYRLDGFSSLEVYARERMGLAPRCVYRLLALHRTLVRLPALRRAFLSGRVTLKQALVLGSVATVVTESAWIERTRSVTLRRLEDEVCFWKHIKEVRPSVWDLLDGGPLPKGIVLVPGRPARLSASASRSGSGKDDLRSAARRGAPSEDGLHSSALPARVGCAEGHASEESYADLPPSARGRGANLTAAALLQALEEAEGALPMPEHRVCLRLRLEPEVKSVWEGALAHCRSTIGETITEWEVLALALAAFWKTWDNKDTRRQRREHRTIDRDGWRCMAPGCRSMGTGRLHEHHIIYKSRGGALTDPRNLVAACTQHHKRLLHEGFIRCTGEAPDDLVWEFGVEGGREPFLVYHGETRVGGTAR